MNSPTVVAPAVEGKRPAAIYIAIELSQSKWVIGAHTPLADKISIYQLSAGDSYGLLTLIARLKEKAERVMGHPPQVVSCYEAGYDGFWLHRFLEMHGVPNRVLDSASIQVNRRARRVKTDRIDVEGLVRVLMAYCRGEQRVCAILRVPSVEDEDAKRLHRERERLVRERVQHTNRIRGLLATQGVEHFRPTRRDSEKQLNGLRTGDGRPLPPQLKAEIGRECRRLALVLEMIKEVEKERAAAASDAKTEMLAKLKGIGPAFATVLRREVFYRAFKNRRELGGYVGLTPAPYDSGDTHRDQGISKAGNPRARTLAIELAWLWLRHQPGTAVSQWFQERVGASKGRVRRIAIVAVARKLLVALWRYVETGLLPTGAEVKA
jgi:transposase